MTDIVKRLDKLLDDINMYDHYRPVIRKAAKEIERLRERVAALQAECGYTDAIAAFRNAKRP